MLTINETVEGEIETIAFGGEGILRYRGFVIFVPFTAIGDRITCRITEVKRSFATGELVEIKHPSHYRTKPLCPYFGTCGGCQLQHLIPEAQIKYKFTAVQDALKRIGHLSPPPFSMTPATENWSYRRHVTLHLKPKGDGFQAGYIGTDHHSLISINTCPIFNTSDDPILETIQRLVAQLPNPSQKEGRLTLLKNPRHQFILSFQFHSNISFNKTALQPILQQFPEIGGIFVQAPNDHFLLGDPYCEEKMGELTMRFSPQTFIQNHPEQSLNIAKKICQLAGHAHQRRILDLYCGFGLTSLLLAKQGHVVNGIELNGEAIRFAKENAEFNQLKNAHFMEGDVEKIFPRWIKRDQADLIIVNPPRQGLPKNVIQLLLKTSADSIIYVSCMPSTLARDLSLLAPQYQIKEGNVYDMFPQTAHVETLVYLKNCSKEKKSIV